MGHTSPAHAEVVEELVRRIKRMNGKAVCMCLQILITMVSGILKVLISEGLPGISLHDLQQAGLFVVMYI